MNNETQVDTGNHGIKWGLIIGVVYAVLVFLRYYFGSGNVLAFSLLTYVGYPIVLVLLFLCGRQLRILNGGHLDMREAFKAMFIAVLIFEAFYMAVTFIYLKYVDPTFFEKLRTSTENLMLAAKSSQKDIDKMLANLDMVREQSKQVGFFDLFKTYLYSVGITGLFALLFAFIIKRKPPVYQQDNFLQP